MDQETKNCQNCKKDFTIESDDFAFYDKLGILPPTFCPNCRLQRRMAHRNERSLYKRQCDLCKKDIISMYDPSEPFIAYCRDCWWGDKWDTLSSGKDYDFSESFFKQYEKLLKRAPLLGLSNLNSINSEYGNFTDGNKGCYLVFGAGFDENVFYSRMANWTKDSMDLLNVGKSELMYECVNCHESYRLRYSQNCKSCTDSFFLYNCRNCSQCFGCVNLVSKSYCVFNKQYTKEEYQEKVSGMNCGSWKSKEAVEAEVQKLLDSSIHKYANITGSTNCTGDCIDFSKNCKHCFDVYKDCENTKYTFSTISLKDNYDSMGQFSNDFSCENVDNDIGNSNKFTITVYASNNVHYSFNCHGSSNLFGCTGLKQKNYCILNKQYTKEEYEELVPKIIEQMNSVPYVDKKGRAYKYGEFFPIELSSFAYNETIAQEYFPLTKGEALIQGYKWKDKEARTYTVDIKNENIPDDIKDADADILNKVIQCGHKGSCKHQCTEAFKIISAELKFYQRMNLPLPRLCPNCRHYERLAKRNPPSLWHRQCMCDKNHQHHTGKCNNEFETAYSPDRKEIIYCEQCYQAEIL